jgi:hypothetical protein
VADLYLYKLQPPPHRLHLTEGEPPLALPGSIPVSLMIEMLNLQEDHRKAGMADDNEAVTRVLGLIHSTVVGIIRDHNPSVDVERQLRGLSPEDCMNIFNTIAGGVPPTTFEESQKLMLEDVVAEQIEPPPGAEKEDGAPSPPPAPTRSRKRSRVPSSTSARSAAGSRSTGKS